jgi:hypothetical protein
LSSASNIALFSGNSGNVIFDGEAMYVKPVNFLPVIACSDGNFTYSSQLGIYTIVGRLCYFQLALEVSSMVGTGSGQVNLTLPIYSRKSIG